MAYATQYNPLHFARNYINGQFVDGSSGRQDAKIDPTTVAILGSWPQSTNQDVVEACNVARRAAPAWASLSRLQRAEFFYRLAVLLEKRLPDGARAICMDTGKTLNEAQAEVVESLHMAQYTFGKGRDEAGKYLPSEFASKEILVLRRPKGVVGIVSPWNFPMAIGGFWSAAPALLEGNAVVWKPSELSPLTADFVANLYHDAGIPKGVFNVVHGDKAVGDLVVRNPEINHVIFTGSYDAGRKIRQACAECNPDKTVQCETGSKSAVIVFADADRDMAMDACVASAFKLSGQRCVSAGRILVERRIVDDFTEQFVERARKLRVGPWTDHVSDLGPLISAAQMNRVLSYNERVEKGFEVLLKGERLDRPGYFLSPHVYRVEWLYPECRMPLIHEVFGPHVAIIPFDDVDHAVQIYNDTRFGLSMGCLTKDIYKARELRDKCHFGLGYWNGGSIAAESHVPFGGVKASGYGWPSAAGTFDAVVHQVAWTMNYGGINFPQGLK